MEPFHADLLNLFNKYLLLVTFETDDNYSIRFEMKKNTICAALGAIPSISPSLWAGTHI